MSKYDRTADEKAWEEAEEIVKNCQKFSVGDIVEINLNSLKYPGQFAEYIQETNLEVIDVFNHKLEWAIDPEYWSTYAVGPLENYHKTNIHGIGHAQWIKVKNSDWISGAYFNLLPSKS